MKNYHHPQVDDETMARYVERESQRDTREDGPIVPVRCSLSGEGIVSVLAGRFGVFIVSSDLAEDSLDPLCSVLVESFAKEGIRTDPVQIETEITRVLSVKPRTPST